jgi:peptidoglycan/LPS O-acetylase OafA/YrhL
MGRSSTHTDIGAAEEDDHTDIHDTLLGNQQQSPRSSLSQSRNSSSNPCDTVYANTRLKPFYRILEYFASKAQVLNEKVYDDSPRQRCVTAAVAVGTSLVPSFILQYLRSEDPKPLSSTAWLDGLRGVAAFFVVFYHYSHKFIPDLVMAWNAESNTRSIFQLPFFRIIFSGTAMVGLFFVISGYVLSYKALKLARKSDLEVLLKSLASSTFRRAMRLFIPTVVSTFCVMLFTWADFFGSGPDSRAPPRGATLWQNLIIWWNATIQLTDPFRVITAGGVYEPMYDANLWTIPVEFRGSIVVFITVLGLSTAKNGVRLSILAGLVIYCTLRLYTEMVLFIGGILLAEIHHARAESSDYTPLALDGQNQRAEKPRSKVSLWLHNGLCLSLFLLSIFILGIPYLDFGAATSPVYSILVSWTPSSYMVVSVLAQFFWIMIGAIICVATLDYSTWLQNIFTTGFAQYLGRISYALYLVHGTLLYTLGAHMVPAVLRLTGVDSAAKLFFGHLISGSILLVVIIWVADLFSRGVDEKSVSFVRWISKKCLV